MNDMHLSDAQLAAGLRRLAPSSAPVDLRARILGEAVAMRQDRPLPGPFGRLTDADPFARRRVLLLAAAALLALGLAVAGVVGALLAERTPEPFPDLTLEPPADLPAFVRSTYELMPQLGPMTITAVENGTIRHRIYVDGSGATRIEVYPSLAANEPDTLKIYAGTTLGELTTFGSRRVWSQRVGSISEDPRVFVYATLGSARGIPDAGCEVAISPGEEYVGVPAGGWTYVGLEYVVGRPAHHVQCGADLWIDVATRLTLRSSSHPDRGGVVNRTIEVTAIELGQPAAELFALRPPVGAEVIEQAESDCLQDPNCLASAAPVVTPRPASSGVAPSLDLDTLIGLSIAAVEGLPAYDVVIDHWSARYAGSQTRIRHGGAGRYRTEYSVDGTPDPAATVLIGPGYRYAQRFTADGVAYWEDTSGSDRGVGYPLSLPADCPGGWTLVGIDVVHERTADHVSCRGVVVPDEYWIDRDTHLVLRVQTFYDEQQGTQVEEVVELRFADQPASLFELPPGADLRSPGPKTRP